MIAGVPSLCFHLFPDSGTVEGALRLFSVAFGTSAQRYISTGSRNRVKPRQSKLHITRFPASGIARSFRYFSSPSQTRFAGLWPGIKNSPGGTFLRGVVDYSRFLRHSSPISIALCRVSAMWRISAMSRYWNQPSGIYPSESVCFFWTNTSYNPSLRRHISYLYSLLWEYVSYRTLSLMVRCDHRSHLLIRARI